jgi:hypothetical protein
MQAASFEAEGAGMHDNVDFSMEVRNLTLSDDGCARGQWLVAVGFGGGLRWSCRSDVGCGGGRRKRGSSGDAPSFPSHIGRQGWSRWTLAAGVCLEQLVTVSTGNWLMDVLGGVAPPPTPSDAHERFERW